MDFDNLNVDSYEDYDEDSESEEEEEEQENSRGPSDFN